MSVDRPYSEFVHTPRLDAQRLHYFGATAHQRRVELLSVIQLEIGKVRVIAKLVRGSASGRSPAMMMQSSRLKNRQPGYELITSKPKTSR